MFKSHQAPKTFWLLVGIVSILLACGVIQTVQGPGSLDQVPALPATQDLSQSPQSIEVFFTDPQTNATRGGPDAALAAAIDSATLSLDIAAHNFNLWSLRDAVLNAQRRGLVVRVVAEWDNRSRELGELEDAGIPVVYDRQSGLMHHKFIIIDRQKVWTGSMNFTITGAYRNTNNLIRVVDNKLAAQYLVEFEEMFVDRRFGPASLPNTPENHLMIGDIPISVYFSPDDSVGENLVSIIEAAEKSIHFLAFSFTADELADALISRSYAGVAVSGVMDAEQIQSNIGGDYSRFVEAGLDVFPDANSGKMHHKVIIIDQEIVITGSYNFSRSAEIRNDENVLVIYSSEIAGRYLEEFNWIYAEASR